MDFYHITSQEILERISRHCPEALSTYLNCVNRADKEGTFFFSRDLIQVEMSESWTKFRNDIKKLSLENLLEWHYIDQGISITLMAIDNEDE